jgi:hypothetical protein
MKFIQQTDAADVHLIINPEITLPKNIAAFQFDILQTKGVAFITPFRKTTF